jgi:hypothetical protein
MLSNALGSYNPSVYVLFVHAYICYAFSASILHKSARVVATPIAHLVVPIPCSSETVHAMVAAHCSCAHTVHSCSLQLVWHMQQAADHSITVREHSILYIYINTVSFAKSAH